MDSPAELYFEDPPYAFQLDVDIHARKDAEAAPGTEQIEYLKQMAASNIKRLAYTGRKKAEIRKWADDEFPKREEMTAFIQTIPLAVIAFITRGVDEFGI
jgi:hypothetical protein